MITVIATGFDGGRKRHTSAREATGVMDSAATGRAPRERDFLEELERQRDEAIDLGGDSSQREDAGRGRRGRRAGRAVGRRAGARQARPRPTTRTTSRSRASSAASEPRRPVPAHRMTDAEPDAIEA